MTGNAGSDFRIKLLVVHPDGRRQKFLVTFPERRTLKIDQRYIGLPLTLRVDFVPGAIIARPGTGHALSIAGKPVKEHSLTVNDVVGLDQYSIEFLELPEPLPMEEATRFVSINDISEATVVVSSAGNDSMDLTPHPSAPPVGSPALPHRPHAPVVPPPAPVHVPATPPAQVQPQYQQHYQPAPQVPAPPEVQPQMYRPDPEDSTAVIRRLQVPGVAPAGTNPYSSLQPTGRADSTMSGITATGITNAAASGTSPGFSDTSTGFQANPGMRFSKKHLIGAGAALAALVIYFAVSHAPKTDSGDSTELASQAGPDSPSSTDTSGEMKPMDLPEDIPAPDLNASAPAITDTPTAPIIPSPQPMVPSPVAMSGTAGSPIESSFDDKSGFDPMAVDSFFDAVDAGDEAKIKDLLDKRIVDVNLSRRRGYAALHLAAARGDLATVKFLIKMKADPNVLDGSGATPIMWSVFRRHEDVVKFLAPKTNLKIERQGGETAYALADRMKMTRVLKALNPDPKKTAAKGKSGNKRVPTSLPKKKK